MLALLLKSLYTIALLSVISLLAWEIFATWFDRVTYIGRFEIVSDNSGTKLTGDDFARHVVGARSVFINQLADYQGQFHDRAPTDPTYVLSGVPTISLPNAALEGVNLTVQGVNLTQLLSTLRRGFAPKSEVTGVIMERSGSVFASVNWASAPKLANGTNTARRFLSSRQDSVPAAADYISCAVTWAHGAASDPIFAEIPREEFCDFAAGLMALYRFGQSPSGRRELSDEDRGHIGELIEKLRRHQGDGTRIPDLVRLRADLLELIAEDGDDAILAEIVSQRAQVAMMAPEFRDLTGKEREYAALALARPAIRLTKDGLEGIPDNWTATIDKNRGGVDQASKSIGAVITPNNPTHSYMGTAFVVAPGLALTTRHLVEYIYDTATCELGAAGRDARLLFGADVNEDAAPSVALGKLVHVSKERDMALVSLRDHDPLLVPSLPLADEDITVEAGSDTHVFLIGYPARDPRQPELWQKFILGQDFVDGERRLMPGRLIGRSRIRSYGKNIGALVHDASTLGGMAGAPLVNLHTSKVLGVHFAGKWQPGGGKLNYASQPTQEIRDLISRRLDGNGAGAPGGDDGEC